MDEVHNLPPNKRTCSRKETNALQADEDIIPHCNPTNKQPHNAPIKQEDHTGGNNTFQYGQAAQYHIKRPLPYMDNQQTERAIICPISHYKGASSTTYHQLNKKSTHGK